MPNMRRYTKDSSLAYYVNQLENLDPVLYQPLVEVSWGRDIQLRPGVSLSMEATSFIQSSFAGAGTLAVGGNMPWISAETTVLPGVDVNGNKIMTPIRALARELSYTEIELQRSQLTGQPIDVQKVNALNTLYQMNTDQMVYIGDTIVGATGLVNSALVTADTVATGMNGSKLWSEKTPDEILADVNSLITAQWSASAFAVCAEKLLLPPANFSYIASQKVSSAGNVSILNFLKANCISLSINGKELDIQPVKWLTGRGPDSANRMVVYTNKMDRVRFPMVPIQRYTAYYSGIRFAAPYIYAFGEVEFVYPETVRYGDGI